MAQGLFQFGNGETLTPGQIDELQTLVLIREPDRLDEMPSNFAVIGADKLNYTASNEGRIDEQGYFHAEGIANGGQALAVLEDDGTISITFRGTNDAIDYAAVYGFRDNAYIYGFDEWLTSVADYAQENGYTIDMVTGKSLGGACTNMLNDEASKIAGGAYADATYFAVASPLIGENDENIINFGYSNDYAFEWYNEVFGNGDADRSSATDNIVYYNKEFASGSWRPFFDFSSHSYNAFRDGTDALVDSKFANQFEQDDFIILTDTTKINVGTAISRMGEDPSEVYIIATDNQKTNIYGTNRDEYYDLGNGKDNVYAGNGDDVIYSGNGDDTIRGGSGDDFIDTGSGWDQVYAGGGNDIVHGSWGQDALRGGSGNDQLFGEQHADKLFGQNGNDALYGGEGGDYLAGGNGNDSLYGGDDNDSLYGGKNNDLLSGGAGDDQLFGQKGEDVFVYDGQGNDIVKDFQAGQDQLMIDNSILKDLTPEDLIANATLNAKGDVVFFIDDKNSMTLQGWSFDELQKEAEDQDYESWEEMVFA